MFLPLYCFFSFSFLLKDKEFCSTFDIYFYKKKSLSSLVFCKTSNLYVIYECIIWCVMCDVPDFYFLRSWLFESIGDLFILNQQTLMQCMYVRYLLAPVSQPPPPACLPTPGGPGLVWFGCNCDSGNTPLKAVGVGVRLLCYKPTPWNAIYFAALWGLY